MTPDRELLRQYAEQGDDAAFAEIVRRHLNWVYSAARRLVAGDAHLAEDVTQQVFTDLARKAAQISHYDAPGGWLHTATRFAAAKAVDRERRRREREQEAYVMNTELNRTEIPWGQLQPVLDEAIGRLPAADRQAVVMRFFEGKSHREIGDLAGLSEDTARKRVERAVEKLRGHFGRQGITVSVALLAEAIESNAVQAAPAAMAERLPVLAMAQATTATGLVYTLTHTLFFMTTTTKTILAAVVVITAVAVYRLTIPSAEDHSTQGAVPITAVAKPAAAASSAAQPTQVVMPKEAAAVVAKTPAVTPVPALNAAAAGSSATSAPVDPKTQDALAMMQPMKALYAEIYTNLMETNNPDTALQKLQELQPQIDELKTKVKGTQLESVVVPALARLTDVKTALQHGDIEGAQKIIQSLNNVGQKVQTKIEKTAGITIEKAAAEKYPEMAQTQN